jgi:hypothetical protein
MKQQTAHILLKMTVFLGISLLFQSLSRAAIAQIIAPEVQDTLTNSNSEETDFSDTGRSPGTDGGGSRGNCPTTEIPLTALVPTSAGGGWTTQANPSLWFYTPFTFTEDYSLRFVLRDPTGDTLYDTTYNNLAIQPGIFSVTLPNTIALDVTPADIPADQAFYEWFVLVNCDAIADRPAMISGTIRRVALGIDLPDPSTSSPIELSDRYVENLIWYDALSTLGTARLIDPTNSQLMNSWNQLLTLPSVGLNDLIEQPIQSDCCSPPSE